MPFCTNYGASYNREVVFCGNGGERIADQPVPQGISVQDSVVSRSPMQTQQVNVVVPAEGPATTKPGKAEDVHCATCGHQLERPEFRCPECHQFICKEHYIADESICLRCAHVSANEAVDGELPLVRAARAGNMERVRVLIERGADPTPNCTYPTDTPLHHAVRSASPDIVRLMLTPEARVDAVGADDRRPLHLAAERGEVKVVRWLLERGADPNARDKSNRAPLDKAADQGHIDAVRALVGAGADYPGYALISAIYAGRDDIARFLLDSGASANVGSWGQTPLMAAADKGSLAMAQLLISRGADVRAQDSQSRGPLHMAASGGHYELCRLLLEAGVDPSGRAHNEDRSYMADEQPGVSDAIRELIQSYRTPEPESPRKAGGCMSGLLAAPALLSAVAALWPWP